MTKGKLFIDHGELCAKAIVVRGSPNNSMIAIVSERTGIAEEKLNIFATHNEQKIGVDVDWYLKTGWFSINGIIVAILTIRGEVIYFARISFDKLRGFFSK